MPQRKKHASARARRNKATTAATLTPAEPVDRSRWTAAQLRAEIDLRNQDRDDGERLSKGGGKAGMLATLEEDDLGVPLLPDREYGWHRMTGEWWADVWGSPMSNEWHPETDYHNVFMAAMHYDDMMRAGTPADRQRAGKAFADVVKPLGLTPYDRRRLEWTIETAREAQERGQKRRGQGSGQAAPPPPAAGAVDPRARLHSVN